MTTKHYLSHVQGITSELLVKFVDNKVLKPPVVCF